MALMNQYKTELSLLIDNPTEPLDEIAEKWNYYLVVCRRLRDGYLTDCISLGEEIGRASCRERV